MSTTYRTVERKIEKLEHDTKVSEKKYYSYAEDKESQDIIAFYMSHINEGDRAHILELWEKERIKRENWHKNEGWFRDATYLQQQNNICFCAFSMVLENYINNLPNSIEKDNLIHEVHMAYADLPGE